MSEMFKLCRRKGSRFWYVRRRWPSDIATILKGEFVVSTREEDKRLAEQRMPLLVAEYTSKVAQARAKLAQKPPEELTEAEVHRMAADFYRLSLPRFVVKRPIQPVEQRALLETTRERLETAKLMQGRNEFAPVVAVAERMVSEAGIELPEDSPSWDYLHRMLMRAFVELHEAAAAHLAGNADYRPKDSAMVNVPAAPEAEADKSDQRTIEQLIEAYEADKGHWSGSSKKAVVPVFRLMRDVFPGRAVSSITRDEARGVVSFLQALPKNMGKLKDLKGLTVPQAVERGKQLGLAVIAPKTINDSYILHIASMFNWARKEQWVVSNPFEGLSVFDPVDDSERRDPFTVPQMQKLFSTKPWEGPWEAGGDKPGAFWVPLLCLFHGLRNGEAAGLRVEDVAEEAGVPVIHVRPYEGQRLKTKGSRATLALHPELVKLGLLVHVAERKRAGEKLLFPEGVANSRGQVAAKLGEWFSAHVKRLGLEGRKLGMHSFRHCFEDALRAAELPERTALALARRIESSSGRTYGDGLSIAKKAEAIAKVRYDGLDLSHLYVRAKA